MNKILVPIPARVRRTLFWSVYWLGFVLSVVTVLAPRAVLEQTGVWVWGWLVLATPVWWLARFVRCLYRGGE